MTSFHMSKKGIEGDGDSFQEIALHVEKTMRVSFELRLNVGRQEALIGELFTQHWEGHIRHDITASSCERWGFDYSTIMGRL
jgi:hypothetical protein